MLREQSKHLSLVGFARSLLALGLLHGFAPAQDRAAGEKTITAADLAEHLRHFASPEIEGRGTPSVGLTRAQDYVAEAWFKAGVALPPDVAPLAADLTPEERHTKMLAAYRRPFPMALPEPDTDGSSLTLEVSGTDPRKFTLLTEFVPLVHGEGEARGTLEFLGYGINDDAEKFDEIPPKGLKGKIVMIVEGEPRTPKRFEGPELSQDADLWLKLVNLHAAGAEGALVVRRPVASTPPKGASKPSDPLAPPALGFRYSFAKWNDGKATREARDPTKLALLPTVEISMSTANAILGEDVEALTAKIDAFVRPQRREAKGRTVELRSKTRRTDVNVDNLVGWIEGSDPKLKSQVVIAGAHLDHLGVDERGRIATGADDNASGSSALLELAQAMCVARPKRSVLICSFTGEEEGELGSRAIAAHLPVDKQSVVAMVNMDMIGFGEKDSCAVLGIVQNPALEKLVARGLRLSHTGIKDVTMKQGEELFARSDHYSFHLIGLPVLFFFDCLPIDKNPDYHTWRDTLDRLDQEKVLNVTRLAYNCTWLLTEDEMRPPAPSASH